VIARRWLSSLPDAYGGSQSAPLLTNLYLNVAGRSIRLYLTALDEYHFAVLNTAETISGQLIK
ncbi:hypothetical protein, partial [Aeromonas veronii]|uniref:hypothetical protein n=1 Tax=Aeromonas veronii TaxID=654 RepID=UPI001F448D2F